MRSLPLFIKLIIYFLLGNILFNTIFSLTEVIIVNSLGMNIGIFNTYINNFTSSLLKYTIIYFIIVALIRIYDIVSVKKLNKKLQKMKGGIKNEE